MLKKSVIILAGMLLLITSCFANTRMQQSAKQQAIPKVKEVTIMDFSQKKENVIYLAGGCFWGLEKLMQSIPGVIDAKSGYANGTGKADAKYQTILGGKTGFRETVRVEYDPAKVSLDHLLLAYFYVIDPTVLNKQGNDTGTQYQTGIYYTNTQAQAVVERIVELERGRHKVFAVEVGPLKNYYPAEEYHQDYLDKNPNGYCHIPLGLSDEPLIDDNEYNKPSKEALDALSPQEYEVTQNSATDAPFSHELTDEFKAGLYVDITTGEPLFVSSHKFNSHCGWPSFTKPIAKDVIKYYQDDSHGMNRIEVRSRIGNAHLGHVFEDGPNGSLRYCINGSALTFIPKEELKGTKYEYLLPYIQD